MTLTVTHNLFLAKNIGLLIKFWFGLASVMMHKLFEIDTDETQRRISSFPKKKAVLLLSYPHWIVMDLLNGTKNIPWRSESKNHPSASIRCTKWVLAIFQYDCRSAWELCVKLRIFVGRWFLDPEEGTAQIRNVNWRQGKEQKSKCSKCGTQTKRRVSRAGPRRFLRQSADICGGEGWDLGPKCRSSASSVV